ncbi:MAG: 3-deoxy-D-manno-octulosonic acid transferase [Oceanospirillaceae bacterium]|nr:3-deoxy-D-manno-octulosonic acid transferase [Oceanospirillaceae bacterium]
MALLVYTYLCYLALPFGMILHLLFIWRRPEFRAGFWQRYGWLPKEQHHPVLIHAASVGELNAIAPLINAIISDLKLPVLVTTTSVTGQSRCQQLFATNERVSWAYLPLDLGISNKLMLWRVRPRALLLVETELWPNLVASCARKNIPTILVNGRLSQRSAKAYGRWSWLVAPMLQNFTALLVQDQATAKRFLSLGALPNTVSVLGSLKYDLVIPDNHLDVTSLVSGGLCVVCGSTRSGEEASLLQAWSQLPEHIEGTLVLVPRHPQRFEEVADLCQQSGLPWLRYTQISKPDTAKTKSVIEPQSHARRILLVDAMGVLFDFYHCADVVFVGGSLADKGGHNPLEPAALGKPVLMGPNCFNFTQVCDQLEQVQALKVTTSAHLLKDLTELLVDPLLREAMGAAGALLVDQQKGALARNILSIEKTFEQALKE